MNSKTPSLLRIKTGIHLFILQQILIIFQLFPYLPNMPLMSLNKLYQYKMMKV